jgi:hypothetical protein
LPASERQHPSQLEKSLRGGQIVHPVSPVTHVADVTAPAPRAAWVRVITGSG